MSELELFVGWWFAKQPPPPSMPLVPEEQQMEPGVGGGEEGAERRDSFYCFIGSRYPECYSPICGYTTGPNLDQHSTLLFSPPPPLCCYSPFWPPTTRGGL